METPLDDLDRRLIALLRDDARLPVAMLARRLAVSRTTAQARLERLERGGVIAGYTVRLGQGYRARRVRAHVMIEAPQRHAAAAQAGMRALPEVTAVYSISGAFDMIAIVEADSIELLDRVIDAIGTLEGVVRTQTSIIMATKFDR
ncbi:MAG: Lrp/AsnC family transcriptional regulator [Azospirillaceae bacterium]